MWLDKGQRKRRERRRRRSGGEKWRIELRREKGRVKGKDRWVREEGT